MNPYQGPYQPFDGVPDPDHGMHFVDPQLTTDAAHVLVVNPETGIHSINDIPLFNVYGAPTLTGISYPATAVPPAPLLPSVAAESGTFKSRRRRGPDGEPIIHRRTRNGCYTCRSRRVKCDEGRPICKKCSVQSRDCIYPDTAERDSKRKTPDSDTAKGSKSGTRSETGSTPSPKNSNTQDQSSHDDKKDPVLPLPQEQYPPGALTAIYINRASTTVGGLNLGSSLESPEFAQNLHRVDDHTATSNLASLEAGEEDEDGMYSHLIPELRDLMRYHYEKIGYHHYFFRSDAMPFTKYVLPAVALSYEPLLYAVCAFSAYHRMVAEDGKIQDFLTHYNKSVHLLLRSLRAKAEPSEAMLLTILQLATIEEYLGDWVNLVSHLRAAFAQLRALFPTPEAIVATEARRQAFMWISRLDIFVGMGAARPPRLAADWYRGMERWHYGARALDPRSPDLQARWLAQHLRVLTAAMTELAARAARGLVRPRDFAARYDVLWRQLKAWGAHIVPLARCAEETAPLPRLVKRKKKKKKEEEKANKREEEEEEEKEEGKGEKKSAGQRRGPVMGKTVETATGIEMANGDDMAAVDNAGSQSTDTAGKEASETADTADDAGDDTEYELVAEEDITETNADPFRGGAGRRDTDAKLDSDPDPDPDPWVEGLPRADRLYLGASFNVNRLFVDLYSTAAMQRASYARIMALPSAKAEADLLAREECRIIDAMDASGLGPDGTILLAQAWLAMLAMYLKEPEYREWVRRKLLRLENYGYSYPPTYRNRLAELWGDPSIREWWTPDGEGYKDIIKALRKFNLEREAQPQDRQSEDVKNLLGFLNSLYLEKDEEKASSKASTPASQT